MNTRLLLPISVVHIEEDPGYRELVARALAPSTYPKFELTQYTSLVEYQQKHVESVPDVVIYDISKSSEFTEQLFLGVFKTLGRIPLILVTVSTGNERLDVDVTFDAIKAGADNVFVKDRLASDLWPKYVVRAIARAARTNPAELSLAKAYEAIEQLRAGIKALSEAHP